MRARVVSIALALAVSSGCYQAHVLEGDTDAARGDGGMLVDASTPIIDATPVDAGRLCGCPGDPAAEVCGLPEMCCPVTRTCEDPSRFRCSGSSRPCDRVPWRSARPGGPGRERAQRAQGYHAAACGAIGRSGIRAGAGS